MASKLVVILIITVLGAALISAQDIHAAVRDDSPDKIKAALDAGADINLVGPGGQTPLMHAVLSGKAAAVKFLLERGADVTIGEKDGYTPMHGAGFQGRAEIAKLLIEHGLDPNDRHSDGYYMLICSVLSHSVHDSQCHPNLLSSQLML
jgi:ankyrin repeat protein